MAAKLMADPRIDPRIKAVLGGKRGATLVESGDPLWRRDPDIEQMNPDFRTALARLVLPERRAGMLASRRRLIDVTALAVLATGLLVAGLVLPTPS